MPDSTPVGVLFLRGVNVGGRGKLPMADLRAVLSGLGLVRVVTHIQSGNAVFRAPGGLDGLATRIARAIEGRAGFAPQVLLLPRAGLEGVLSANPFAVEGAADGASVHIGFLAHPSDTPRSTLQALAAPNERLHLTEAAFYLHAPSGIGRSKLAAGAEKALGVPMTMRNHRVATAVAALAQGLDA
jgi:uncharacterized protein (DUF1697 family)